MPHPEEEPEHADGEQAGHEAPPAPPRRARRARPDSSSFQIVAHPRAGLRRHAQRPHAGAYGLDAGERGVPVEPHRLGEVDLGDQGDVGGVEDGGVLERLVLALGDGEEDEAQALAQIVGGRADQVADVLDEEEVELVERPAVERGLHHRGLEVADRAGRDLPHRRAAPRQAGGVVFGGQIAHQRGDAESRVQPGQRLLQQRRLPGARARDQADHEDARLAEPLPERAGHQVVLLEDVLPHFDEAWLVAHVSISRATSSSSRPLIHLRRGSAALRAAEGLHALERTLGLTAGAEDDDRHLFDHQPRSLQRSLKGRHLVRREQRLGYHAGQRADPDMQRADAPALPAGLLLREVHQAHRDRELVHGPSAPSAACPRLIPPSFGGTRWLIQSVSRSRSSRARQVVEQHGVLDHAARRDHRIETVRGAERPGRVAQAGRQRRDGTHGRSRAGHGPAGGRRPRRGGAGASRARRRRTDRDTAPPAATLGRAARATSQPGPRTSPAG